MPAVQINGVTTRAGTVPFGVPVSLTNGTAPTVSQTWEILRYPEDSGVEPDFATNFTGWTVASSGGATYLHRSQAGPYPAVTFTPDISGSYLIRLTADGVQQTAVVRVKEEFAGFEVPAAGETTQAGAQRGWETPAIRALRTLARRSQGYVRVGNVSGGSLARGKVVRLSGTVDAHALDGGAAGVGASATVKRIPTVVLADKDDAGATSAEYAVLDETIANNGSGWAQISGLFDGSVDINATGFTPGNRAYLGDAGAFQTTGSGVILGTILEVSGAVGRFFLSLGGQDAVSSSSTFSSGLTDTAGVITNNLITGKGGGQTIIGGTGDSEQLLIRPTSSVAQDTLSHVIIQRDSANTNARPNILVLRHRTSGVPAIGLGGSVEWQAEDSAGNDQPVAAISPYLMSVTDGAENGAFLFRCAVNGTLQTGFDAALLVSAVGSAFVAENNTSNTTLTAFSVRHKITTGGAGAVGIGVGISLQLPSASSTVRTAVDIRGVFTDVTNAAESASFRVGYRYAGTNPAEGSEQLILHTYRMGLGISPLYTLHAHDPIGGASVVAADTLSNAGNNYSGLLGRIASTDRGFLYWYGTLHATSGAVRPAGAQLSVAGAGGLSYVASDAAGVHRFYTAGSGDAQLRFSIGSTGLVSSALTDAATNTTTDTMVVEHISSATTTAGFGAGLVFKLQVGVAGSSTVEVAKIRGVWHDGTSRGALRLALRTGGGTFPAEGSEQFRFSGDGFFWVDSGGVLVPVSTIGNPAFSCSADTNTGLTFLGSDVLAISAAGTERFRFTAAGFQAVKAPGTAPHIIGDLLTVVTGYANQLEVGNTSGSSAIRIGQAAANNLGLNWEYNATAANAIAKINTTGNSNPIEIDGSEVRLQKNALLAVTVGGALVPGANDDLGAAVAEMRQKVLVAAGSKRLADHQWDFITGEEGWANFAGTAATDGNRVGGIRQTITNGTASHTCEAYLPVSVTFDADAGETSGDIVWGVSYRFRYTGTVDAGTEMLVGFGQGGGTVGLWLGIHGSTSTTKYVLQLFQGTTSPITLSSDSSIDGNWHQLDLVHDKTNLWTRVDRGTWRSHTRTGIFNSYAYLWRRIKSGTAATVHKMELDWVGLVQEGL